VTKKGISTPTMLYEETTDESQPDDPAESYIFWETLKNEVTADSPEKLLMLAVFRDAVDNLRKYQNSSRFKYKLMWEEARNWVLSDKEEAIFSFVNICETFGLSPSYLRRGLSKYLKIHSSFENRAA
jgi:hypothetical protein